MVNSHILMQKQKYEIELDNSLTISDLDKQHIVNAAVDVNKTTPHEYQCYICLQILYEPKECSSCEVATFCTPCIQRFTQTNNNTKCPSCQNTAGFRGVHRKVMAFLNDFQVQCIQEHCQKRGEMMRYEVFVNSHPQECVLKKAPCPNGCGMPVSKHNR